jgi:hypothetical protein
MRARSQVAAPTLALRFLVIAAFLVATTSSAGATPVNTNDINVYNTFKTGATVQSFESIAGVTPLALNNSYTTALNASTTVPVGAQLLLDITGLLFHSGGGSVNDPTNTTNATPTAVLQLGGTIAGDAHSATNVVGSQAIKTAPGDPDLLDIDQFIEIVFINALQSRVGVWLNPSLGNVLITAFGPTAFNQLEQFTGNAGNFVGFNRPTADIKHISIIGLAGGFTVDDLTYAGAPTASVPEPGTFILLGLGSLALLRLRRNR